MRKLRLLLLQTRDNQYMRRDEKRAFVLHLGIEDSQIDVINMFDEPLFDMHMVDAYDGLVLGGASEASLSDMPTCRFFDSMKKMLLYCVEQEIPVFASCFGFQAALLSFGAELVKDTVLYEMGSIPIETTLSAQADPLFRGIPQTFLAISVHQEKVHILPDSCELLAKTEMCCHAFRVKGKPFWGFQFHPEIDIATLTDWLTVFKDKYTDNEDHFKETLALFEKTPYAHVLLKNFITYIQQAQER